MSKRKTAPTLSRVFVLRLALDGLAAAALVFAFAYHWQGNLAHEAAGLGIFLLLCMHNPVSYTHLTLPTKRIV